MIRNESYKQWRTLSKYEFKLSKYEFKLSKQWRTLREILGGGGGGIFNMYAFGIRLRYANLSNIMLGISNSLFDILL